MEPTGAASAGSGSTGAASTGAGPAGSGSGEQAGAAGALPPTPPLVVDEPGEPSEAARARPASAGSRVATGRSSGSAGLGGSGGSAGSGGSGDAGSRSGSRRAGSSAVHQVRELLASALMTVAVLAALVLASGAGLVATGANPDNRIVSMILDVGSRVVGPFADMFTFEGEFAKGILINWGIAALVYLIAGSVLRRVIRP